MRPYVPRHGDGQRGEGGEGRHGACGVLGTVPQPWGGGRPLWGEDAPPPPCREGGEGKKGAAARRSGAPGRGACSPPWAAPGRAGRRAHVPWKILCPASAGEAPGRAGRGAPRELWSGGEVGRGEGGSTTTPRALRGAGAGGAGCPARSPQIAALPGTGAAGRLPRVGPRRAAHSTGGAVRGWGLGWGRLERGPLSLPGVASRGPTGRRGRRLLKSLEMPLGRRRPPCPGARPLSGAGRETRKVTCRVLVAGGRGHPSPVCSPLMQVVVWPLSSSRAVQR